jgi:hypothetical protein
MLPYWFTRWVTLVIFIAWAQISQVISVTTEVEEIQPLTRVRPQLKMAQPPVKYEGFKKRIFLYIFWICAQVKNNSQK